MPTYPPLLSGPSRESSFTLKHPLSPIYELAQLPAWCLAQRKYPISIFCIKSVTFTKATKISNEWNLWILINLRNCGQFHLWSLKILVLCLHWAKALKAELLCLGQTIYSLWASVSWLIKGKWWVLLHGVVMIRNQEWIGRANIALWEKCPCQWWLCKLGWGMLRLGVIPQGAYFREKNGELKLCAPLDPTPSFPVQISQHCGLAIPVLFWAHLALRSQSLF